MRNPISTLFLLLFIIIACNVSAQPDVNKEMFKYQFIAGNTASRILYLGKSHSFTLEIKKPNIKEQKSDAATSNQHYLLFGKTIFQTSIIDLPPIPAKMILTKLTYAQQQEAIEGYITYELEYFRNSLQTDVKNLSVKSFDMGTRRFVIWSLDAKFPETGGISSNQQVYLTTLCFNKMLTLNSVVAKGQSKQSQTRLLFEIAKSLKTYNIANPLVL